MGWLQDTVGGALDFMHDTDPLGSAILNGVIDVDTAAVGNLFGNVSDVGGLIGDDNLSSFGHHWEDMANRDNKNHARAVTNAGLTLAALYGGYYAAGAGAGTAGGAAAGGASSSMALNAATGGDQDSIARAGLIGGASGYAGNYASGAYGSGEAVGAAGSSPVDSYLTTGSSDLSTVGGNGGYAGSISGGSAGGTQSLGARAVGGAVAGGTSAALSGGNIAKGAITGGLSAGTPDVGGTLGITDPNLRNAFNSGLRGAAGAALQGGNIGAGAISGAVPGLIGYGVESMGNSNDDYGYNVNPLMRAVGDANSYSVAPWAGQPTEGNPFGTSPNYGAYSSPAPWAYSSGLEGGSGNPLKDSLKSTLGYGRDIYDKIGGARGVGDIVQGLAGLYAGNKLRSQMKNISGMIGGNRSAYEQQLRKELMARDAAAGRRSDYGGRAVQLQSALAQLDSHNAPALAQLSQLGMQGNYQMLNSGLSMLGNLGAFGNSYMRPQNRPIQPMPTSNFTPINFPDLYQQRNTIQE